MSSDDSEKVILRTLEGGAAFYIVKPINKDDLKNVWQYAVATKTGKYSLSIKEIGGSQESSSSTVFDQKISVDEVSSAKSTNIKICNEKDRINKNRKRTKEDQEVDSQLAPKKPKVVWTNSLHSRFLQAINHIGLDSKQNLLEAFLFFVFFLHLLNFLLTKLIFDHDLSMFKII
jgi:two-component response regulator (ARR-B family)